MFRISILILIICGLAACDSWVKDVATPQSTIDDTALNSEAQIPFLVAGVETQFAAVHDQLTLLSDLLSDAFFFDPNVPNATNLAYSEVDVRHILLQNSAVTNAYTSLGTFLKHADLLVARVNDIGNFKNTSLRTQTLYKAHLYSAIGYYSYAVYFGWSEKQGGSPTLGGSLETSNQLLDKALARLDLALANAVLDADKRVINTFKARIFLFKGDVARAAEAAKFGMLKGDLDFVSKHSLDAENDWFSVAGRARTQMVADARFVNYIVADPKESSRVLLETLIGSDGRTVYRRQAEYTDRAAAIPFLTWQENELILAELELTTNPTSALFRVNAVRDQYALSPLTSLNATILRTERDKTFFAQGMRLLDQRRFDQMHPSSGKWEFLPVPQSERQTNVNLNGG